MLEAKSDAVVRAVAWVGLLIGIVGGGQAHGLTIQPNYVAPGETWPGDIFPAREPPATTTGGGDLQSLFAEAAAHWESVILTDHTVIVDFGWAHMGPGIVGDTSIISSGGGRPLRSRVKLDSDSFVYFMDATPADSAEWDTYTQSTDDLGGGILNTGRQHTDPSDPDAVGRIDLYSIILHELGHALGLSSGFTPYLNEAGDNDIDVAAPLPHAGTAIPVHGTSNAHITNAVPNAIMVTNWPSGERRLPSDADILAIAQVSQFDQVNLLPEPAVGGIVLALGMLLTGRRRTGRRPAA
jgi:hypothetical protein